MGDTCGSVVEISEPSGSPPDQLQPLIAALLLGVVTDYCVLFFFAFHQQLRHGLPRQEVTRRTVATDGPIVAVAGITVAAGTAALSSFQLFRAFGPALSMTVMVGLIVSLTLVPAVMAVLGKVLFLSWQSDGRTALGNERFEQRAPTDWSGSWRTGVARQ